MTQSSVLYGYRFDSAGMSPDAHVFDVAGALEQPRWLDKSKDMELGDSLVEIHSAAFGERDMLVLECSGLEGEAIPQLFAQTTGCILEQWPEFHTGCQGGSLIRHLPPSPPFALDPVGRRFAVATDKGREVVRILPE